MPCPTVVILTERGTMRVLGGVAGNDLQRSPLVTRIAGRNI